MTCSHQAKSHTSVPDPAILHLHSDSPDATEALGIALGRCAARGDLITLDGDLGAGKTALTRGIARGLGIDAPVTSPTFTLQHIYGPGTRGLRLYHDDVYRLEDAEAWYGAGLAESLTLPAVTVIEWADRILGELPAPTWRIRIRRRQTPTLTRREDGSFELSADDAVRTIEIRASACRLTELDAALPASLERTLLHDDSHT